MLSLSSSPPSPAIPITPMPNNAFGHANAGYAALAVGEHLRAHGHFTESLRMDPHFDLAHEGLLSSLRARIWATRLNLKLVYLIRRPATFQNAFVFIGVVSTLGFIGYLVCAGLNKISPDLGPTAFGTLCLAVVGYVVLSLMVSVMMNFALLFDPIGPQALTKREKSKMFFSLLRLLYIVFFLSCGLGLLLVPVALLIVVISIQFPHSKTAGNDDAWSYPPPDLLPLVPSKISCSLPNPLNPI